MITYYSVSTLNYYVDHFLLNIRGGGGGGGIHPDFCVKLDFEIVNEQ